MQDSGSDKFAGASAWWYRLYVWYRCCRCSNNSL